MVIAILVLLSLSASALIAAGVSTVLRIVNANRANLRRIELRDYWDARSIVLPDGTELVHSPFAQSPGDILELDACIHEFRAASQRAGNYAKLTKDWLLCSFCLAGIALVYCYLLSKGRYS